ncbi:MAG: hypothetical protein QM770_18880 [Tepidisphaeraceae bacterium]
MPDARTQFDQQYHEMRWRILSLAADFDRLQRYEGGDALLESDARVNDLRACLREVLSTDAHRAERVQSILSDKTPAPQR